MLGAKTGRAPEKSDYSVLCCLKVGLVKNRDPEMRDGDVRMAAFRT